MTRKITHKLKISATMLCDEWNKYILAQSFNFHSKLLHIARNQGHFEPTNNIVSCISFYTPEQ